MKVPYFCVLTVADIYVHQIFFWKIYLSLQEFQFHDFYFTFIYILIILSLVKHLLDFWISK